MSRYYTFGSIGNFGHELGRAGAHAFSGGFQAELGGGSFWQGALSGGLASELSSGIGSLAISGGWSQTGTDIAMLGVGGLSGGLGSVISGGNFWQGAGMGFSVAGLNHIMHSLMSGGPPWEYNGRQYNSKGELYRAILVDQSAEQFGIKDLVALAAAVDNAGLASKPFQTKGASKGTSYTSKYGAKLLPQKMPMRLPTHVRGGTVRYTKVFGRFLGRMAGPIGWGVLAYDVGMTLYNTQTTYNGIINN